MRSIRLVNASQLSAALREYAKVTKKTEAEIVNKTAKDVAFRAAQFTPKVPPAQIEAELQRDNIALKIATRIAGNRSGQTQTRQERRDARGRFMSGGATRTVTFTIGKSREQIAQLARDLIRKRKQGSGALRAGWIPAILALGGKYRGAQLRPGGSASKGFAKKATFANIASFIVNAAFTRNGRRVKFGAGEIRSAIRALERAVNFVARDRLQYVERKLRERLNRFNSRKRG